MRKLRHSKNEDVTSTTPRATGLVGLLETMRAQLEECFVPLFLSCTSIFSQIFYASNMKKKMLYYIYEHAAEIYCFTNTE